jgi:hypothetical protein
VLNLLAELDYNGRLELSSTKSDWTKPKSASGTEDNAGNNSQQSNKKTPTSTSTNDALVIYFMRHAHVSKAGSGDESASDQILWNELKKLYRGTQAQGCASVKSEVPKDKTGQNSGSKGETLSEAAAKAVARGAADAAAAAKAAADAAAKVAAEAAKAAADGGAAASPSRQGRAQASQQQNCVSAGSNAIELRTMPVTKMPNPPLASAAPLMRTYSALGILKNATQPPNPRIGFVSPEEYWTITHHPWNNFGEDPIQAMRMTETKRILTERRKRRKRKKTSGSKKAGRLTDGSRIARRPFPMFIPAIPARVIVSSLTLMRGYGNSGATSSSLKAKLRLLLMPYVAYFERGWWYYIDPTTQYRRRISVSSPCS